MIDLYLDRGDMFALYDDDLKARVVHLYDLENNLIELFCPLAKDKWSADLKEEDTKF